MKRRAFTLVELLVVMAIVGIMIALLFPAIQAAREAVRKTSCQNNLRQIGIATLNYHDANRTLPAGNVTLTQGICRGDSLAGTVYPSEDGANWLIALLPFMEESALHKTYSYHDFNEAAPNRQVREAIVAAYVCPVDIETDQLLVPASGPACVPALNLAYRPGSYRGMCGRSDGRQFIDSASFQNYPRSWRGPIHTVGIGGWSTERHRNISDGLSHSILAGESSTRTNLTFRTFWSYSYAHYSLSSATPQGRTLLGDYDECVASGGNGASQPCRRGWGSNHPASINFVFCDSSVHSLSPEVDLELFANLGTISGNETRQSP